MGQSRLAQPMASTLAMLFTDHANQFQLNQVHPLTAQKPLDPKNPDYQWGFKVAVHHGSDARYTQFLLNRRALPVPILLKPTVQAHPPWLTEGGIARKAGQYPTPLGYETIDPSTNLFYPHAHHHLPVHPAVPTHRHADNDARQQHPLDVYAGAGSTDSRYHGKGRWTRNGAVGGIAGFGLNLMDGKS